MSIKFASKLSIVTIAASIALSGMASSASAGGFLADVFIKPLNPSLARQLDQAHEQMGKPLDRVPMDIANMTPAGQFLGNRCATPFGMSGPGPVNPLGMPCNFNGAWGQVVR